MSGRQVIPDIRAIALQDEAAVNDLWTMELVIRYAIDSAKEGLSDARE